MATNQAHWELATDRLRRPIRFTEHLWSSAAGFAGPPMERHRVGPQGRLADFAVPDLLLGLCIGGSARLEVGGAGRAERVVIKPGRFVLLDRGDAQRPITWQGVRETLYLRLPAAMIERLAPELSRANGGLRVTPQYGAADLQVRRLVQSLQEEATAGSPTGAVYAESLGLALASILASRYGAMPSRAGRVAGIVFTRAKQERLHGFIAANLGRNISLGELAAEVGLSPHYFVRVFRNTFLATPHQYLLHERTECAKRLLAADGASISEVGLALGFADQSHFTNTFRRLTGRTPSQFRRDGR